MQITSPATFCFLASISVITPFGVDTIAIPRPLLIFGKQSIKINLDVFDLKINEGKDISIKPKKLDDTTKRLWGMNRSLINNAVIGSSTGYEKTLELVGVGYRAALKGNQLNLQ